VEIIREAFGEESMSCTRAFEWHARFRAEGIIIFFDNKGIVHKEFILASQTVNSAYYCDLLWLLHENV
jgi:hypothetical protein